MDTETQNPVTNEPTTIVSVRQRMEEIADTFTQDEICEALTFMDFVKEQVRQTDAILKANAQRWMEHNKVEEFSIGTVRYYIGPKSSPEKCEDPAQVLRAVMLANGNDPAELGINVNDIALCLSKNGWKPGTCKKILRDEVYRDLFKKQTGNVLHVEGSKRSLQSIDTKFIDQE